MNEEFAGQEIERELEEMSERAGEHIEPGRYATSYRMYGEMRRRAKAVNRVLPYLHASFYQMDQAQYLLDPETMRDRAVELIAYLESEERAREMQPEFPEEEYAYTAYWMTACAYENLAEATGKLEGYNSDGMHACISDGLVVCRRTGKLECTNCFREYATDVYTAADDIPMARYQCQLVVDFEGTWSNRGDRRWLASVKSARLSLLEGQIDQAREWLDNALKFCAAEEVTLPGEARLTTATAIIELCHLTGQPVDAAVSELLELAPDKQEWLALDWEFDLNEALLLACQQDYATAIDLLQRWDQSLSEQRCLVDWFETRLRLIALHRLAGKMQQAASLGRQLESKAQASSDWLTTRRLERLLDESIPATPLALLAALSEGPFATESAGTTSTTTTDSPEAGAPGDEDAEPDSPLKAEIDPLMQRLQAAFSEQDEQAVKQLVDEFLAFGPDRVTTAHDAGLLIYLMQMVCALDERDEEIWNWANALALPFQQDGVVLNVLATLGNTLRSTSEAMESRISNERIDKMFRESLKLEGKRVNNFRRAGDYFFGEDDLGQAEWCYARGFRLDRTDPALASRLAEVYNRTDRPRDALNALDMCLREGCDEPQIAWEAAMFALNLERYESLLTYLDLFDKHEPEELWTCYYRATALFELDRIDEALAAVAAEAERGQERRFHLNALRACCEGRQGNVESARKCLRAVLDEPLSSVDFLTLAGLVRIFDRLWTTMRELLADDDLFTEFEDFLLRSGMAPDGMFEAEREIQEAREVNFYRVRMHQPLDATWATAGGCLCGQEQWPHYFIEWGVLGKDEEEARQIVSDWQSRCAPLPAEMVEIECDGEGYRDFPGIVWQGMRWSDWEPEDSDDDFSE